MRKLITLLATAGLAVTGWADSNINDPNDDSYGANVGWMSWRADGGTNGVVIGEFVCSGFIYAANVGWIHLGDGTPDDGIQYSNTAAGDFGVNNLGDGRLRGFGYGANIGWVNFEPQGNPRIDLFTGTLTGFAYGANIGWISLSNAQAFVQADSIEGGADTDGDGITDAYELAHAGNLVTMNDTTDSDGDGVSDLDESQADTDPFDFNDFLRITAIAVNADGSQTDLTWTSRSTRHYGVQKRLDLLIGDWADSVPPGVVPADPGLTTTRTVADGPADARYFRVKALRPLAQ